MNSQQMDGRKKAVKKEKWEKQTKMITERVGSAISSFFGSKKPESPGDGLSNAMGKRSEAWLDRSSNKMGSGKVSKARRFLSNIFRKGKMRKISDKGQSGLGQGEERETATSSSSLPRVSSRRVSTKPRLKIARSMRNRGSNRVGGESEPLDEDPGLELCKRRVLMGGKCRPLQASDDTFMLSSQR